MKLLLISVVDVVESLKLAFEQLGWEVTRYNPLKVKNILFKNNKINSYLLDTVFIRNFYHPAFYNVINKQLIKFVENKKFDLVIIYNNSKVLPETINYIKDKLNCPVVCYAADDPTLTLPYEHYLETMLAFTHIITFDSSTETRILKYSKPKIINLPGAVNTTLFFPINKKNNPKSYFNSKISYCSSSNQGTNLGIYRGAILRTLTEYELKIYGDKGWLKIAKVFPELKPCISVKYLNHRELNELYNYTDINISIINPTLIKGIPNRVFEIAGSGGFQIAEYKDDLSIWFENDEIETFRTIDELKEKVLWYLNNPTARDEKAKKLHYKVINNYTWQTHLPKILNFIFQI